MTIDCDSWLVAIIAVVWLVVAFIQRKEDRND